MNDIVVLPSYSGSGSGGGTATGDNTAVFIPPPWCSNARSAWNTLAATSHGAAVIIQFPQDGNISAMAVGTAAAATPVPLRVRVETLSATGLPSGSLIHANAIGTAGGNAAANALEEINFAAPFAVTQGLRAALVVQPSTSPVSLQIASVGPTGGPWPGGGAPYAASNTTGSWAKTVTAGFPMIGVRYDTGDYAFPGIPIPLVTAFTSRAIGTGTGATTGTRRGIWFQLEQDFALAGAWFYGSFDAAASNASLELYDDDGLLVATLLALDGDLVGGTSNRAMTFIADATINLTAGIGYRLVITPTTANTISVIEAVSGSAAMLQMLTGTSIEVRQTAYINSAWVETATSATLMGLMGSVIGSGGSSGTGPLVIAA
jgi:hypothetical protein